MLDAGGVMIFPQPDLLRPPLQEVGVSPDVASFERAHYRAMVIQDLAAAPPAAGTWWREYLVGYFDACGVAEDQCRDLAAAVAAATMGQAWICFTAESGTLEKKRSEMLRSKTMSCESRDSRPENMPTAPCRMVTTVSIAATLNAIPAMLISVRMRCRPRLVRINRRKIMMPE